ncbi:hypothetical protein ABG067_005808 [Albugo candida]
MAAHPNVPTIEEKRKSLEKYFTEKRPPLAYAKLSGRIADDQAFEALITHLPTELGRGPIVPSSGPVASGSRISLGEQKAISRQHAKILWNAEKCCFEMECLGKNGLFVNGSFIAKNQVIPLTSKTPIRIGPARLYFLQAIRSACSTMSAFKFLQRAFEKMEKVNPNRGRDQSHTPEEIMAQILEMFPRCEPEIGGKDHFQDVIIQYMEQDTQNFQRVTTGAVKRYTFKAQVTSVPATTSECPIASPVTSMIVPPTPIPTSTPLILPSNGPLPSLATMNPLNISHLLVPMSKKQRTEN